MSHRNLRCHPLHTARGLALRILVWSVLAKFPVWWCLWTITPFIGSSTDVATAKRHGAEAHPGTCRCCYLYNDAF
jgi:hypothetical protein